MEQGELPGILKKLGRPKTSTLSRKEQMTQAAKRYRKKQKAKQNVDDASSKIV